jgi:hypothetical protein
MLGDNSSFDLARRREIQIPTSWGNDEISFVANSDAFPAGVQAYLFVVDAAGNATAGHPVSLN